MFKIASRALTIPAAALSMLLIGQIAEAQTTTPPAKSTTPPPAAAPAAKAPTPAKEAKKAAPKKKVAVAKTTADDKTPSACQGLEEKICRQKADECFWIAATTRKDGKAVKAYCRHKPTTAAKKPAEPVVKKAAPATTTAKSAPPADTKK